MEHLGTVVLVMSVFFIAFIFKKLYNSYREYNPSLHVALSAGAVRAKRFDDDLQGIIKKFKKVSFDWIPHGKTDRGKLIPESAFFRRSDSDSYVSEWKQPNEPLWSAGDESHIQYFYKYHIAIDRKSWLRNCKFVDRLLKYVYEEIKEVISVRYNFMRLEHFVRQGSANDGLKISAADEFDAVLPFTFHGIETEIIKAPDADLLAGVAEVCIPPEFNTNWIKPAGLITLENGKQYVNTKVLHDIVFKSLVDKAICNIQANCGRQVSFRIKRKSGSPALALGISIRERCERGYQDHLEDFFISVDVVPGIHIPGIQIPGLKIERNFLVTRWIPEAKNRNLLRPQKRPHLSWRISYSSYETSILKEIDNSTNTGHLLTACMILKGIKEMDVERDHSSQLSSVLKSYHLKNVLLFALLYFTKFRNTKIKNVTEALSCLVDMVRICLRRRFLPQFFTSNFDFHSWQSSPKALFEKDSHLVINLLEEKRDSIDQVMGEFNRAVSRFKLYNHGYMNKDLIKMFDHQVCTLLKNASKNIY